VELFIVIRDGDERLKSEDDREISPESIVLFCIYLSLLKIN
jgi:hypothetical protein